MSFIGRLLNNYLINLESKKQFVEDSRTGRGFGSASSMTDPGLGNEDWDGWQPVFGFMVTF